MKNKGDTSATGAPATAEPSVGRRERKKIETRRAIRHAALDLALELGMDNLTIEAITEAADVSPRTFFNYFSCKEDALVTDTAKIAEALLPLIEQRPLDESPLRTLRIVLTEKDPLSLTGANRERSLARQRLVRDNPDLMSRQLARDAILQRQLAEVIADRLGLDPVQDLRPALLAGVAGTAVQVAVRRWAAGGSETLVELLCRVFDELEQGELTRSPAGA